MPRSPLSLRAPAFTAVELIICICVITLIVAILLPAMTPRRNRGHSQLKDSTQVRGIVQSMVIFSQNSNGDYPLPSKIDTQDLTVAAQGQAKDTTGSILSIMIFNGNLSPEICITPRESNSGQVQRMDDYAFTTPAAAVNPANALWDPRFRGTPIDAPIGNLTSTSPANQSYAHILPIGERRKQWRDTFSTTEAVFGNRGPQYAANDFAPHPANDTWNLIDGPTGRGSNTLLIHGGRTTWEGNVAYNDGHVQFETKPAPDGTTYLRAAGDKPKATPDNLFVNESDEIDGDTQPGTYDRGRNTYLRPIAEFASSGVKVWID